MAEQPSSGSSRWLALAFALAGACGSAGAQSLSVLDRPAVRLTLPARADAALLRPDGAILVGGRFDLVQGEPREGLARIDASGALDPAFDPRCRDARRPAGAALPYCEVHALLALPDGSVLVGGSFTEIGGLPRAGLARLRADGTIDPAWDAALWGVLRVVELDATPSGVVVGVQDGPRRLHRRISARTGAPDAGFPERIAVRRWLVDRRGRSFAWRAGVPALVRMAEGEADVDPDWRSGLPAGVQITDVAYHAGVDRLFAVVSRSQPGTHGASRQAHGLLRLDPRSDGGYETDWTLDPGASDPLPDGAAIQSLFAGADARLFLVVARSGGLGGVVAIDPASGRVLSGLAPAGGARDGFRPLADGDGRLLVANGDPDSAGSLSPDGSALARLHPDLSLDGAFRARVRRQASLAAAAVGPDGAVVVHGDFTRADDRRIAALLRLRPDLSLDPGWVPFATVEDTAPFTALDSAWTFAIDPTSQVYLARYRMDSVFPPSNEHVLFQRLDRGSGQVDTGWSWTAYGDVGAIAMGPDGDLYSAHATPIIGCNADPGLLARLRLDQPCAFDPDWRPALGGTFVARVVPDGRGRLFVHGRFEATLATGDVVRQLARIGTGTPAIVAPAWRPMPTDAFDAPALIRDLAIAGDSVLVAGDFTRIAGEPWRGIARLAADDARLDRHWNAGDLRTTYALAAGRDGVLYSSDRSSGFDPNARLVARDLRGDGRPLATLELEGGDGNAAALVALADGGALVLGGFARAGGVHRTGLLAVALPGTILLADGFEPR